MELEDSGIKYERSRNEPEVILAKMADTMEKVHHQWEKWSLTDKHRGESGCVPDF